MALDYLRQHPGEAILTDVRKVVWLYGWHKVPRSFANSSPKWDAAERRVVEASLRPARQDVLYTVYLFLWGVAQPIPRAESAACMPSSGPTRSPSPSPSRDTRLETEPLIAALAAFAGVDVATSLLAVGTGAASPFDE